MGQLARAKKTDQWAVSSWPAEVSAFNLLTPTPTRPCSKSTEVEEGEEGRREGGGGVGMDESSSSSYSHWLRWEKYFLLLFFTSFHYLYFHRFWWFRKTLITVLWFLFTLLCLGQRFSLNALYKKVAREKDIKQPAIYPTAFLNPHQTVRFTSYVCQIMFAF